MSYDYFTPGATVVGVKYKDGVILAAEKRVTYGFTLMSRSGKKVFKITGHIGIACAGFMADMQAIARTIGAEAKIYELDTNKTMKVRSAAKLLSQILFSNRLMPYYAESVIGGIDNEGAHIYALDAIGSLIEDKYVALGTGAQIAIAILESEYKDNLSEDDAKKIAIKAVKTAVGRDAVSGDGIDMLIINKNGVKSEFIPLKAN